MKDREYQPMAVDDLIQSVTSYSDLPETETVLSTAYDIAARVHSGFRRLSGDSAISHSLAVETILAGWHAPLPVVTAGLLHDIHSPDYSHGYDLNDVKSGLGEHIARILRAIINLNSFVRQIEDRK